MLQGVGALMVITSFFVPEKIPAARINAGPVKMHITPTAGQRRPRRDRRVLEDFFGFSGSAVR